MEGRKKELVFGIVAPPDEERGREFDAPADPAVLEAALPHLPRYKDETSIWKIFQTGLKPPIPGRLR